MFSRVEEAWEGGQRLFLRNWKLLLLWPGEIKELRNGIWELDCCKMILRKNTSSGSDFCKGSGYVKRTATGELNFKLYTSNQIAPRERGRGLSGQLVKEDEYYQLSATDTKGRAWKAGGILPKHEGWHNQEGHVIFGTIPSKLIYTNKTQWHVANATLGIYFFDDIEIPCNTITTSSPTVGDDGDTRSTSWGTNVAQFSSCGCDFTISRKDNTLVLRIMADSTELPLKIESRCVEALQFVLGKEVRPVIVERNERNIETVAIRPILRPKPDCRFNPPLSFNEAHHAKEVWELYDKYLSYILNYTGGPDWHPLSIFVHRVIHASAAYSETLALEVAVAVEGILQTEFEHFGCCTPSKELAKAHRLIKQSDLSQSLKSRIGGAISAMKYASPADKLKLLVESAVIEEQEYKAWKKLRNTATHPKKPYFPDLQKGFDLCDTVVTLFYKLIFHVIGYNGKYTDYGQHGWPIKEYPKAN